MASLLDEIVNAQAPALEQRQNNRALAGGSRDGTAVWNDGSLFINAADDTGPSEADRTLVKQAMNGDKAARAELELRAALGDAEALNALTQIDDFQGESPASNAAVVQAAMNGDKAALDKLRLSAAMGDTKSAQALQVIDAGQGGSQARLGGGGESDSSPQSASRPRSGGGGGGTGSGKKNYQNTQGQPSSVPHTKVNGADYNKTPAPSSMGFDDLPPVKSSAKPPPPQSGKGDGDKVHAYGNKNAKTGDVDIVNGQFVWKGDDQDQITGNALAGELRNPTPGNPLHQKF